ncbi:MAG: DUF6273 domain-containing protein [Clostridiaceae bacterium]|nr:DUF6273 domain-containing protein [Clostridiaceae bacterium]
MKKLNQIPRGTIIPFAGYEWIVLEHDGTTTRVLMKDILENRAFDDGNDADWRESSARAYLNGAFLDNLQDAAGDHAGSILPHDCDLTAADGTFRETSDDTVSLLTLDEYRRNRDVIEPIDAWWWLITRDSASNSCNVRYVSAVGSLDGSVAYLGNYGLRPALTLDSELLISEDGDAAAEDAAETARALAEVWNRSRYTMEQIVDALAAFARLLKEDANE